MVASTFFSAFGAAALLATPLLAVASGLNSELPAIDGKIKAVAGSEYGLVALTDGAVVVLDPMGHRLRTWRPPTSHWYSRRSRTRAPEETSWSALSVPAQLDWARAYDLEEVDDPDDPRLADEPGGAVTDAASEQAPGRRHDQAVDTSADSAGGTTSAVGEGTDAVTVATAGGRSGWVGGAAGLWEIDLQSGAVRRRLVGRSVGVQALAASASGQIVVLAQGSDLYRSHDGGRTFELISGLRAPGRGALAVTEGGAVLVFDRRTGSVRVARDRPGDDAGEALPVEAVRDVTTCGEGAIILAKAGVYLTRAVEGPGGAETVAVDAVADAPAGATRIACAATGTPWLVSGQALLLAHRRERVWRPAAVVRGEVMGMAFTGVTPWVATASGLWASARLSTADGGTERAGETSPGRLAEVGTSPPGMPSSPMRLTKTTFPRPSWWDGLLPRVDAVVASARLATRRDWRALLLLTFALGRTAPQLPGAVQFGAAPGQTSAGAPRADGGGACGRGVPRRCEDDPISVDEQAAVTRILEETSP